MPSSAHQNLPQNGLRTITIPPNFQSGVNSNTQSWLFTVCCSDKVHKTIKDTNSINCDNCYYVSLDKNGRVYNTIIMDNGANVYMFPDKWMFTKYKNKNVAAYFTAAGGQKLLIWGVGDIYNLKDVLHAQGIVKNLYIFNIFSKNGMFIFWTILLLQFIWC